MTRVTKEFGAREYDILVPRTHNGTLLFALSGWGQKLKKTRPKLFDFPRMTNFDELCRERGYILVYPHAKGFLPHWNFKNKEDINFCSMLINSLKMQYEIKRIYGCGFSQGGVLLQALEDMTFHNFNGLIIHSTAGLEEGLKFYKAKFKVERSDASDKKHPSGVIAVMGGSDRMMGKHNITRLDDIVLRYKERGCTMKRVIAPKLGHEWDATRNQEWFTWLDAD